MGYTIPSSRYLDTRNLDILTPPRPRHTLGWPAACLQIILIKFAHPCTLQRFLYRVSQKKCRLVEKQP